MKIPTFINMTLNFSGKSCHISSCLPGDIFRSKKLMNIYEYDSNPLRDPVTLAQVCLLASISSDKEYDILLSIKA